MSLLVKDWARNHRFAGSKDRAFILGLCMDVLRRKGVLSQTMNDDSPRALALSALRWDFGMDVDAIAVACTEDHGPGALKDSERDALSSEGLGNPADLLDIPSWLHQSFKAAFRSDTKAEAAAFSERAPVDLRVNTLKANVEKATKALASIGVERPNTVTNALRIPPAAPNKKGAAIDVLPAYGKGWIEVQDLGSQIASACAGSLSGAQVLDFCAGGGGKTLALAALAGGKGQIYAYDKDAKRLSPIFERLRRAGVRTAQVRSPAEAPDPIKDLQGKMDLVFVDAPCTGSGTWRRRPDTKWRLTQKQFDQRLKDQRDVLREASAYVKPGGVLIWVTCSVFVEENETQIAAFLSEYQDFSPVSLDERLLGSGVIERQGVSELSPCASAIDNIPYAALRLSPRRTRSDGFFVSALLKTAHSTHNERST
ncbi:MAG: RsmB/NOP family class I SAM-dependent RNA methyltransferase [Pseudomonadota bacterium]